MAKPAVAITDTGTGMTSEIKSRVFEPFYSTKTPYKGSGLGLSTCFGIMKQSGGDIHVYFGAGSGDHVPNVLTRGRRRPR